MPTVYCPKCAYNLTGIDSGRCPECGQPFDRAQLEHELKLLQAESATFVIHIVFYPMFFAFFIPACLLVIAGFLYGVRLTLHKTLLIPVAVIAVLIIPALHGLSLGRRYVKARMDDEFKPPISLNRYPVLYAIFEVLLTLVYAGVIWITLMSTFS